MKLPEFAKVDVSSEQLQQLIKVGHEACDRAAKVTVAHFRQSISVENKDQLGGFDPVTVADKLAEDAIRDVVLTNNPQHSFLGEEGEPVRGENALLWVVDPIDGTRSFITGVPLWGTLIAVYDGVDVVMGMLDQPVLKERYVGYAGSSELQTGDAVTVLSCRAVPRIEDAVLLATSPDLFFDSDKACFEALRDRARLTRYGGDCYCYAQLAMGLSDIVLETGLQPYDIQAVIPIVEGAGGVVTDWQGGSPVAGGAVVSTGSAELHEQVLKQLNR